MNKKNRKVTPRKTEQEYYEIYIKNREQARQKSKRFYVENNISPAQRLREKLDKIEEEETICYQFTLFSVKFKEK